MGKVKDERETDYETNNNTKTFINSQPTEFLNKATGETLVVDTQISKWTYGSEESFWKCYLMDFLSVLGVIDSKQAKIFIHIVKNTNQANNLFIGTYRNIAEALEVSHTTIALIMKKLQQREFIKKIQNGVWQVNPNILMKGSDLKRRMLLLSYQTSEKPIEKEEQGVFYENNKNT